MISPVSPRRQRNRDESALEAQFCVYLQRTTRRAPDDAKGRGRRQIRRGMIQWTKLNGLIESIEKSKLTRSEILQIRPAVPIYS